VPDRLFWAHDEPDEVVGGADGGGSDSTIDPGDFPLDTTRH
jgi:hypothetical protein